VRGEGGQLGDASPCRHIRERDRSARRRQPPGLKLFCSISRCYAGASGPGSDATVLTAMPETATSRPWSSPRAWSSTRRSIRACPERRSRGRLGLGRQTLGTAATTARRRGPGSDQSALVPVNRQAAVDRQPDAEFLERAQGRRPCQLFPLPFNFDRFLARYQARYSSSSSCSSSVRSANSAEPTVCLTLRSGPSGRR
jgi:hypothetical protein